MNATTKRYMPDGSTRAIWADEQGERERRQGILPRRGSRIEVITSGPKRGRFYVDFTPLAEALDDDKYRFCLATTFAGYVEANHAEIAWLLKNWVLETVPCSTS